MRVSSSAPSMSRRSVMQGIACGLAGASVPVAAIAGITASRLGQDALLIERCTRWKQRRQQLEAKEKQLRLLADAAHEAEPKTPAELFETIQLRGIYGAKPYHGPWTKGQLGRLLKIKGKSSPTDKCKAHVQRLFCLIDEHAAARKRVWAAHKRLDRQWARQLNKNDQLIAAIMRTEAQTLHGAAAQIELLQIDESFSEMATGSERADDLMTNVRRLIAALPVEA